MIHKIVLTGGPCGGKTSALPFIATQLRLNGYYVVTVPESATLMFNNGFILIPSPDLNKTVAKQTALMKCQMVMEDSMAAMEVLVDKPLVVLSDRGVMDAKAYSGDHWSAILSKNNWTEDLLLKRYDAVYHLTTAAIGTDVYTKSNNAARFETVEEAIDADRRTRSAWSNHPHFNILDNSTDFNGKLMKLVEFIQKHISP